MKSPIDQAAGTDGVCPYAGDLHGGPGVHQRLDELRALAPVVRVHLHGTTPAWLITRATDVEHALTDARFSSNDHHLTDTGAQSSVKLSMMGMDGPGHRRLRRLITRPLGPAAAERLRSRIEATACALADDVARRLHHQEPVDLMHGFARPLPMQTLAELLTIPRDQRSRVHQLVTRMLCPAPDTGDRTCARAQVRTLLADLLQDSSDSPVLRALADSTLSTDEALDAALLVVIAGYETTAALIGTTLKALLQQPGAYDAVAGDPARIPGVVEEALRLEGPIALGVTRYTTDTVTIKENLIPSGARVLLSLGAADRDLDRQPHEAATGPGQTARGRTLAFGHGPHYCPGAHLARLQAHIAVAALAARLPSLALTGEPAGPMPGGTGIFHGPEQLLVRPLARPARS